MTDLGDARRKAHALLLKSLADRLHTLPPPTSGVYFFIKDQCIVYVGQSKDVFARIPTHKKRKLFDQVVFIPVPKDDLLRVERAFIRVVAPVYNDKRHTGFHQSEDLDTLDEFGVSGKLQQLIRRVQPIREPVKVSKEDIGMALECLRKMGCEEKP